MIEKFSVYFGQFLVVKTEGVTASLAGSVKQIKKIRQATVISKDYDHFYLGNQFDFLAPCRER
jgi:hypothetical protein